VHKNFVLGGCDIFTGPGYFNNLLMIFQEFGFLFLPNCNLKLSLGVFNVHKTVFWGVVTFLLVQIMH